MLAWMKHKLVSQLPGETTTTSDMQMTDTTLRGFHGGSMVKLLPTMRETQVQSLGQEDPLEKEMATHSSFLA